MLWIIVAVVVVGGLALVGARLGFKGRNPMWSGPHSDASARGKTIVVTGANSGIGKALAQELALRGADKLILACRSLERARKALQEMVEHGADASRITIELVDLMSFQSVVECSQQLAKKYPTIDALVCNAGVMQAVGTTGDGIEKLLQANHLGHFLLVERLKQSCNLKRVVFVSSLIHKFAWNTDLTLDIADSMLNELAMLKYSRAKLAEVAYAKYLGTNGLEVYSCNPGVVHTNILSGGWMEIFETLFSPVHAFMMKSPLEGAQTPLMLTLAPSSALEPGSYYSDCKRDRTHAVIQNKDSVNKIYDQSKDIVKEYL